MSETEIERIRRSSRNLANGDIFQAGPSFLGEVLSGGTNLAIGKFAKVKPVEGFGPEVEGGPGTFSERSGPVMVVMLGREAPKAGDRLKCRFVDYRWVAQTGAKVNPSNLGISFGVEQPCPQGGLNRYTVPYKITSIVDPDGVERITSGQSSSALITGKAGVYQVTVAGITTPDAAGQFFTFADPVTVSVTVNRPATGNSVSITLIGPTPSTYTVQLQFDVDSGTNPRTGFLVGNYAITGQITKSENFNYQQNNPDNPSAGATSLIRVMVTLSDPLGLKNANFHFKSGFYEGSDNFSYAFCRGLMQNGQNVTAVYIYAPPGGHTGPPGGPTGAA